MPHFQRKGSSQGKPLGAHRTSCPANTGTDQLWSFSDNISQKWCQFKGQLVAAGFSWIQLKIWRSLKVCTVGILRAHFDCHLCHHDRRLGWWLWKVWRWLWAWLQLSARRWIWIPGLLSSLSSPGSPGRLPRKLRQARRPMMRCGKKSSAGDPNCLMSLMSVKGWSPLSPRKPLWFFHLVFPLLATPKKIE